MTISEAIDVFKEYLTTKIIPRPMELIEASKIAIKVFTQQLEETDKQPHWKPSEEQKPEAKLTGWVVRDRSGEIWVHDAYPKKEYEIWVEGRYLPLNQNSFPDLKWGDEPVEVEITIRKKNNTL